MVRGIMAKATETPKTPTQMREAVGLSLHEAARRIGIAPQALAKIEAGAVGVSMATVERVAAFYGVTRATLVAGCDRVRGAA